MTATRAQWFPDDVVATYRDAGLWGTRTVADEFHAVAAAHPGNDAVVTGAGGRTYAELDARTDRLAVGLADLGLRPGDPVIVQITNRLEAVVAWYALLKAGLVPVAAQRGALLEVDVDVARQRAVVDGVDARAAVHAIADQVASVEAELGDRGRVLVRPSGTEPLVRVMAEAPTAEAAEAAVARLIAAVEAG